MEPVYSTQDRGWLDLGDVQRLMAVKIAKGVDFELRGDRVHVRVTRELAMCESEYAWLRAHKSEVVALLAQAPAPEARP